MGKFTAKRQYRIEEIINKETEMKINSIYQKIESKQRKPNYHDDLEKIKKFSKSGSEDVDNSSDRTVDLFLKNDNKEYYIDITSPKPNKKEAQAMKLKLLTWAGWKYSNRKENIEIYPHLAMTYNPEDPKSYQRFTVNHLYDLEAKEIMVQNDFWSFFC